MLLAIDISNTGIKFGLYQGTEMRAHWRIATVREKTADEYGMLLGELLRHVGYSYETIDVVIVSCVVPPLTPVFQDLALHYCAHEAIVIDHTMDVGVRLLTDNPWETGTDRMMSTLAAHRLYGGPAIVIQCGTATSFDVVSAEGDFLGGAIAPGMGISAEALARAASRLYQVELKPPPPRDWAQHDSFDAVGHRLWACGADRRHGRAPEERIAGWRSLQGDRAWRAGGDYRAGHAGCRGRQSIPDSRRAAPGLRISAPGRVRFSFPSVLLKLKITRLE